MAELDKHEVAWLEGIVDTLPATLIDIATRGTTCHSHILPSDLGWVEDQTCLRAPAPHAVFILIEVLHRRVACDEDHRLTRFPALPVGWQFYPCHHSLQGLELWVMRIIESLSS